MPAFPKIKLGEPVVVAVSAPNETRWGFTQFPAFSPLPDGRILITYADAEDLSETHGCPAPALSSADGGLTWSEFRDELVPSRPHFSVSQCYHGEFMTIPSARYLNVRTAGISLPPPVSEGKAYNVLYNYRVKDLPAVAQAYFHNIEALRWTPSTQSWQREIVHYTEQGMLAWRQFDSDVLPRTFLERPVLRHKGELFYADYRVRYATSDGHYPGKGGSNLMVSSDNGHTFTHRSIIALDRNNQDLFGEPALHETSDGGLVAVLRRADHEQKTMSICYSHDRGYTWTPPRDFCNFGVFPYLARLDSGMLIVSYGRPGVWLRFNADGKGHDWSEPVCIHPGDEKVLGNHTCGYTSMHVLGPRSFLLAYSDFDYRDAAGVPRKAILSRRIDVLE